MTYPKEQTYKIYNDINDINTIEDRRIFYINNIIVICNRENVPKL